MGQELFAFKYIEYIVVKIFLEDSYQNIERYSLKE
jgi:hypothetical protein